MAILEFKEFPPRYFPPSFVPTTIMEQTLDSIKEQQRRRAAEQAK